VALLLAASGVAAAVPGRASAEDVEAVRFAYDAPPACPDAEAFVKEVRARTTRFRVVESGTGLRSFEVHIVGAPSRFRGTVRVVDGTGVASARTVDGAQCDDVAKTLAFVTAISIDPKALPAHDAPGSPPSAEQAQGTPAPPPASAAPPASAGVPASQPAIATAAPQEALAQPPPAPAAWHVALGVGAFAQGLAAPGPVVGEAAFVGVAWDAQQVWSPELRIGVAQASSSALDANPGSVSLAWIVARADACPVRWPPRGPFAARPCLTADVGALSASAAGVQHAQSPVRPWGTLGALALAEWEPIRPLLVGAEVSLSAPVQRDQFYVQPTSAVYQAPAVVPAGALELGVRFP
jgi:hypothetical protein